MLRTKSVPTFAILVAIASFSWVLSGTTGSAVELEDGRVYFNSPPSMVNTNLSPKFAGAPNPNYSFSLTLPDNAGESLSHVEIVPFSRVQTDGAYGLRSLKFRLEETRAYTGKDIRSGAPIAVTATELAAEDSAPGIDVQFDQPLAPGQTVTMVLEAVRNPSISGPYLYGVTAVPSGEKGVGQFLGYASFSVYDRNDDGGFFN